MISKTKENLIELKLFAIKLVKPTEIVEDIYVVICAALLLYKLILKDLILVVLIFVV